MTDPSTQQSPRRTGLFLLALVLGALPFAFGVVRAVTSGHDLRYLWTALASFLGATAAMSAGKARTRPRDMVLKLSAVALVTATVLAALTARLLGARSVGAVWFVAFGFGICSAAGCALAVLSRQRPT